ncbi:MAG TPA: amino acid adenylation domain-containing protein [Pyrinomonadaceae bacterium]|jgi:amino acid adenylation domain-containing protein
MSRNSKTIDTLSATEKRALLAELLRKKSRAPKTVPVSFAQQRLWFLDQLEPGSSFYNIPTAVRLRGSLDTDLLERSLNEIVRRHESLRTTFRSVDGKPVQVIAPALKVEMPVVDLSRSPERESEAQRLAREETARPFDLEHGPLVRMSLLRLGEDDHVAMLTMHHIISDGWSMDVLVRELTTLYAAYSQGAPSPLPELPIQYADFARWQREQMTDAMLASQLSYWKRQLEGAPTILQLPTDYPPPLVRTNRGAQHGFTFPRPLAEKLRALSQQENVTLYMTILAAFYTLLYRYTNQDDILLGTPVAGRTRTETESLIGFFVNTLVLRAELAGNPSFRELLKRVRETTLDAQTHQDVPFEMLVEELQPERSLSHTPIFQVMFALVKSSNASAQLPGLTINSFSLEGNTSKFDLMLTIEESPHELSGLFEYSTDLFRAETVERMAGHFQTLLASIVEQPEKGIDELRLLDEAERREILASLNVHAPSHAGGQTLQQLFEQQAARTPGAVALSYGDERLTYAELNRRANQLAHYLRRQGVEADTLVGLLMERSTEMLVGLLGILKAGGAYVPLDPAYPQERLTYMLSDSQAPVLLTESHLLTEDLSQETKVVRLDADWEAIASESEENCESRTTPDSLAYVIYTSGSTGRPKGVAVSHANVSRLLSSTQHWFNFNEQDVWTLFHSYAFDFSVWEIWGALAYGGKLVVVPYLVSREPEEFYRLLVAEGVTVLNQTPSAFRQLIRAEESIGEAGGLSLRYVIFGGEALELQSLKPWFERHGEVRPQLVNMYGITETTVHVTYRPISVADLSHAGRSPIGCPIPDLQVYVLDRRQELVPVGVPGEMYVGGSGLARNYLKRPELTAERFIPNPFSTEPGARLYRTGDLARQLPGGDVEYLGRIDQQVKVRGFRIELGEIEAALAEQPGILEAVVVAREEGGDKRLVAYVVTEDGEASVGELREALRSILPDYMIPSAFVSLDALPLTPSGKINRRALPAPDPQQYSHETEFVAPRTVFEEMLAGIWQEVLRIERVGLGDNFFELGGHSLLATQVVSRVRESFRVELPVRRVFEHPTLAGLAANVENALKDEQRGFEPPPLQPVSRVEPLPLSFAQQRLWFLSQLEPESAAYNIPLAVLLSGQLNVAALEETFNEIIRRHETLRTTFAVVDGEPVQVIEPAAPLSLTVVDLSGLTNEEREARARSIAAGEAERAFDLSREVLRIKLVRLAEDRHLVLLTMHHIITDGWSMSVLVREVAALYNALANGEESPLAELQIQYADFAHWQRAWLTGEVLETQLAYWREKLEGAPAGLELLTDRPRPPVQTFNGADEQFEIPASLTASLKDLSRKEGSTLFMTLLAAFQSLLYRYTNQTDILVGTPIAGRTRAELEGLIGFFVNTLVLRTNLSGELSFRELLRRVRETALGAYAHQEVPFELLVEELKPARDMSRTPFFQVMMAMQNAPEETLELPGLKLSQYETQGTTAKYELALSFVERDGQLFGSLEYNTDLFDQSTITRLLGNFETLLAGAAANPAQQISELPLLTEEEQHQLLVEWNDTRRPYFVGCIHQLFEAQVERTPEALALMAQDERLTYAELNARANRLARHLRALGVGAESRVGILLERSARMVSALLAVLKAGGAYVPLDPAYPQERLSFMVRDAGASVLVTEEKLAAYLAHEVEHALVLDGDASIFQQYDAENLSDVEVAAQNLAYVIYTSGSTGMPKGVEIQHGSLLNLVAWHQSTYEVTANDRATQLAGLGFDASVWEIWPYLSAGASLFLVGEEVRLSAARLVEWLSAEKISLCFLPTPLAEAALKEAWPPDVGLRAVLTGGDKLHNAPPRGLPFRLVNHYGPTENTVVATCGVVSPDAQEPPSIGRPIANTQAYVLDSKLRPVPSGVAGELFIGGASLARSYLNRPELTAERFIPNPFTTEPGARLYRTGDLVRWLPGGELEFNGRIDQQVKVRGFRIELGEIEAALARHPSVKDAVVVAREEGGDKRLVAYVVSQDGQAAVGELREALRSILPDYMIPSAFVSLDALPLTPNGKIDRKALPAPERAGGGAGEDYVAPRDLTELELAHIWEEVLHLETVGIRSNFFELGGHSLLAVRLFSLVEEKFGAKLPLASLFRAPTVEQLAEELREQSAPVSRSPLVEIRPGEQEPALFFVHPVGGNVLCYADLARTLDLRQPFYGFQAQGIDGEQEPLTSVEAMAARYIEHLRAAQPSGPYVLGGWSMGGVVAYEMAQQLREQGEEIASLSMLDSYVPTYSFASAEEDEATLLAMFAEDVGLAPEQLSLAHAELAALEPNEQLAQTLEQAKASGLVPESVSLEQVQRLFTVFKTNNWALKGYVPKPYAGNVNLFRASDEIRDDLDERSAGWSELVEGNLNLSVVPGNHYTMLREPHVKILAERLKSCLYKTRTAEQL